MDAWNETSVGLTKDALAAFSKQAGAEARYGEAITLLMRQPKTAGNVEHAAKLLTDLVANEPNSELGIGARYYLGRIEQTHRMTPNPAGARHFFQELITSHPSHTYAQQAVVKLAIIDLYEPVSSEIRRERFDAFTEQAGRLSDPVAKRDLFLLLADTAQRFDYAPAVTLELLVRADEAGIARRTEQANTWVRIGILASENNRPELARRFFERFLATHLRDSRRLMIEERLAELPSLSSASHASISEAAR